MWEPVHLPFQTDTQPCPALPSTAEIRACTNVLWDGVNKVIAVNDAIVVKFGTGVRVAEGQALIYLEQHVPEVPAPRLHAMYYDSKDLFLVMQRAPGVQLNKIWATLTESEKDDITGSLKETFGMMRQVECPWPDDFYGGLDGGSLPHYLFYSQKRGERKLLGPYHGEGAFVNGLVGNFRALIERNKRPDFKVRFYEEHLLRVLKGHRPTLTHGDVQQKNIVVKERKDRKNSQGERSFDVMLVDWGMAGWFPGYWEFFCASDPIIFEYWEDDWCWRVQQFLEVWPAEMAILRMIDKDLGM